MAWERRVSERTKSEKTPVNKDNGYSENISRTSGVTATMSGGISFCPRCNSLMSIGGDVLTCSQCGYSLSREEPSNRINRQNRSRRQARIKREEKQRRTKQDMNQILRLIRQGKTRAQAAQSIGIPEYRIDHWYREGKLGTNADTAHFYRELNSIEKDRERRHREEVKRQNRILTQKRERQERLNIQKQMNNIVSQMKRGKTRAQAASYVGVSVSTVNEWFNKGRKRQGKQYIDFFNKVNTQEIRQKNQYKPKSTTSTKFANFTKCSKCGKYYNSTKNSCPHCADKKHISSKITSRKTGGNIVTQMEQIVSLMRSGLSRSEAAGKLNINVVTVNNWYNKGKNGELTYIKFYNNVKNIEKLKASKSSPTNIKTCSKCGKTYNGRYNKKCPYCKKQKTKPIKLDNQVTCPKCGKKYSKLISSCPYCKKTSKTDSLIQCPKCNKWYSKDKKQCPHCETSKSITKPVYCQNCGKKIDKDDMVYCSKCGASIKTGKKPGYAKTSNGSTKPSKEDSFDWKTCCMGVFVIFIIIAILRMLI